MTHRSKYPSLTSVVYRFDCNVLRVFQKCIALVLLAPSFVWASSRTKTDVVYMRNGDKITCEIRSLEQGQLTVKPDYTNSTIVIDWTKVDHLESAQNFIVLDPQGRRYTGSIGEDKENKSLAVINATATATLPYESVIQVETLGETFLKRLRGQIDLGTSFARSNQQRNLTLNGGVGYLSPQRMFTFDANSQFTSQQKTNNTNETTLKNGFYQQLRDSNWFAGGMANFLSSSEQEIDLRSTLGGALAKRLIFTNRTNLTAIGGLGLTVESNAANTTSTARNQALDSAFAVQFSTFRFDSTTFDTTMWLYPSLTSPGRVRMTLNQDVYYKFLGDFYVRVSFYDNYDNQPVVGAPTNNLGATTSLGWSFH
jgi:hypothetical protein